MYGLTTSSKLVLNERIQIFHEDRYREVCEASEGLTVRVQCRRPGAKTTEVEACVAT